MKITVNIDEVSLNSAVEQIYAQGVDYSFDGSPEPGDWHPAGARTLGDLVATQLVERLVKDSEAYPRLRQRMETIRDEEIRSRVVPVLEKVLTEPFRRTNDYGEPTGPEISLRELVVKEALKTLNQRGEYGRGKSWIETAIEKAVQEAFLKEIAAEVKVIKDAVSRNLGTQAASAIEQVVKNALAGR